MATVTIHVDTWAAGWVDSLSLNRGSHTALKNTLTPTSSTTSCTLKKDDSFSLTKINIVQNKNGKAPNPAWTFYCSITSSYQNDTWYVYFDDDGNYSHGSQTNDDLDVNVNLDRDFTLHIYVEDNDQPAITLPDDGGDDNTGGEDVGGGDVGTGFKVEIRPYFDGTHQSSKDWDYSTTGTVKVNNIIKSYSGYEFQYAKKNGSSTRYTSGDSISVSSGDYIKAYYTTIESGGGGEEEEIVYDWYCYLTDRETKLDSGTTSSSSKTAPSLTGYTYQGYIYHTSLSKCLNQSSYDSDDNTDTTCTKLGTNNYDTVVFFYTKNNYTITYNLGNGTGWSTNTVGLTQTVSPGSSISLRTSSQLFAYRNKALSAGNIITFNANGGNTTKSQWQSDKEKSYTHTKWNTSKAGVGTSYAFGETYTPTGNITLYPYFSESIGYSKVTLPTATECTRTGYILLGWANSSTATDWSYAPGAEYPGDEATTLYAVWQKNTYAVKYNIGNGVEWQGTLIENNQNPSQTKKHGVALTLRSHAELNTYRHQDSSVVNIITFEANGGASSITSQKVYQYITYEHNGWNTNSASSGTRYNFSGSYTANAAVTLYPHFNKTIDYNYITMPDGSKCTQKGYVLKGWATTSNATNVNYTPGQSVYGADIVSPVLYAIWEPDKYTATYICYSSSGKHLRDQRFTASYGSSYTASFAQITGYQTPNPITNVMGPENKSYTITYPLINYPININCNGGSGVSNSTYNIESSAITLGTPTRTGYTFTGWTGSNGTTPQTSVTISANSYGDKSYTANWTANTYTYNISYKSKSGKVLNTQTINGVFDTTNLITPPAFTGYTTPSAQNITWDSVNPKQIEFVYEPIEYTLSINYNNGTPYISDTYTIESEEKILQSQSRSGYAFCGWTGTEITSPQETVTIPSGSIGARAYVATWAPLIVFNFKKSDTDLLKNLTNTQGIAINWYASESQMKDFINKVKNYCNKTITLSEWQTLDNYNAIVDALNNSSAPIHFSGTTKPNLTKKSKDSYIQAQDLLNLENAFNNRKFI